MVTTPAALPRAPTPASLQRSIVPRIVARLMALSLTRLISRTRVMEMNRTVQEPMMADTIAVTIIMSA